jgi:hypothetical protein
MEIKMSDSTVDANHHVNLRIPFARVLCRSDFPADSSPEERKGIWEASKRDYILKAGRLLKLLERDGFTVTKTS